MSVNDSKDEQFESINNHTNLTDDAKLITTVKNPRSGLTAKKYQKKIYQRRSDVEELLFKGYDQQEIIDKLHQSQSTISRDIAYIHGSLEKYVREYGKSILGNHVDVMNGTTELQKRAWKILDNPKTNDKMVLKAIEVIMKCYHEKRALYDERIIVQAVKQIIDENNVKEKYFRDNNITLDFTKPKSIEVFTIEMNEMREDPRKRKDFVF
jgi:predicted transcriptional regulator